jgi:argininosuccinate lyase
MKLWNKDSALNKQVESFTVGDDYILDHQLVVHDCLASIAHAHTLQKAKILDQNELKSLTEELQNIIALAQAGKFKITQNQEDCHTAIENHLTKQLGDLGKKIHTGRSRNDQVLAALRLFYKAELPAIRDEIKTLLSNIKQFKSKYGKTEMPGYTHTRKAMVSSIKMWCDAFAESMEDNQKFINWIEELIDQSPLGTGAGYGVPLDLDREFTAKKAGFKRIQKNPIYVQNSRGKFESSICHVCSQIMLDLNRMASDLILFSMPTFGYFNLPPDLCTGSSIMPQKQNPDVLELTRAKYHVCK